MKTWCSRKYAPSETSFENSSARVWISSRSSRFFLSVRESSATMGSASFLVFPRMSKWTTLTQRSWFARTPEEYDLHLFVDKSVHLFRAEPDFPVDGQRTLEVLATTKHNLHVFQAQWSNSHRLVHWWRCKGASQLAIVKSTFCSQGRDSCSHSLPWISQLFLPHVSNFSEIRLQIDSELCACGKRSNAYKDFFASDLYHFGRVPNSGGWAREKREIIVLGYQSRRLWITCSKEPSITRTNHRHFCRGWVLL